MEDALRALNLPPLGTGPIMGFVASSFVVGIALVFVYAAIRPRFGAGPKTAVIAGMIVWFFAYLYGSFGMGLMGVFPAKVLVITTIWGLLEVIIAATAGAALYQE